MAPAGEEGGDGIDEVVFGPPPPPGLTPAEIAAAWDSYFEVTARHRERVAVLRDGPGCLHDDGR